MDDSRCLFVNTTNVLFLFKRIQIDSECHNSVHSRWQRQLITTASYSEIVSANFNTDYNEPPVLACETTVFVSLLFLLQEVEEKVIEDKALRDTENAKEMENPLAVLKGILSEVWYVKSLFL